MKNYAISSLYKLIYGGKLQKGGAINKNIFITFLNNKKFYY